MTSTLSAWALLCATSAAAHTDVSQAPRLLVETAGGPVDLLPLKENLAEVEVVGVIAHVRLTQRFQNDGSIPLDATYVFPASTRAAVHAMRMTVGTRVVRAALRERDAAAEEFRRARESGRTASLLAQDRPNVFTMRVANILPADVVTVELEYSEYVPLEDGIHRFVLPGVVGPRFTGAEDPGAPRVQSPPLVPGATHRHDIVVRMTAPVRVADVHSPSHSIGVDEDGPTTLVVLDASETNPGNRDFILQYRLTGDAFQAGVMVHEGAPRNTLFALVEPPRRVAPRDIRPREYIFVVDVSGSMHGQPLGTAALLLRKLVSGLGPEERFNLVLFESAPRVLGPRSVRATTANVNAAIAFMQAESGGGGTRLLDGLQAALAIPRAGGASRSVVVITDGFVNVEASAMRLVQAHLQDMNVFTFGIGQSVNRHLVEGLARAGRGEAFVVLAQDDTSAAADRFWEYIRAPVMTDVHVRFSGLDVQDVVPARQPDVFANRPLEIMAHFTGVPRGEIIISGVTGAGPTQWRVPINAERGAHHPVLPVLWARQRIGELSDAPPEGHDALRAVVLPLALEHGLLSPFTSFVAVDDRARGDGDVLQVEQPSPLPAGIHPSFHYGQAGTLGGRGEAATLRMMSGTPVILGSIPKDSIQRVIRGRMGALKACYERELLRSPALAGRLVVRATLSDSGRVTAVTVTEDSLGSAALSACVLKQFKAMSFPGSPGGGEVTVNYPLVFTQNQ